MANYTIFCGFSEDLVSYWRFDESSGTTLSDSVGSNNGTLHNMTDDDWVAGKYGRALEFDGVDDYVEIAHDPTLTPAKLSFSAWVNPDASAVKEIFLKGTSYSNEYFEFFQSYLKLGIRFNSNDFSEKSTNNIFTVGSWTHIVVTYDKDLGSDNVKLYVNGDLVDSWDYTTALAANPNNFIIGAYPTGSYPFKGKIDEVRIHKKALTQTEVENLYNYNTLNGIFTLTGIATALNRGYTIAVSVGEFVLSGVAATLTRALNMAVSVGTFTLTGIATTFTVARKITASVGKFILTGISVVFRGTYWGFMSKKTSSWTNKSKHISPWGS